MLLSGFNDVALLVLRVIVGTIFLVHGLAKLAPKKGKKSGMDNFMIFLGIAETLGGAAAILGFLTQIVSLGLVIIMIGALIFKGTKFHAPFTSYTATGWEFDFILLGAAIVLLLMGAGYISLDSLIGLYA